MHRESGFGILSLIWVGSLGVHFELGEGGKTTTLSAPLKLDFNIFFKKSAFSFGKNSPFKNMTSSSKIFEVFFFSCQF